MRNQEQRGVRWTAVETRSAGHGFRPRRALPRPPGRLTSAGHASPTPVGSRSSGPDFAPFPLSQWPSHPFLRNSGFILPRDPARLYSEEMNPRIAVHVAVLATVSVLLAGCSGPADGDAHAAGKPLQLRLVSSTVDGTCTAPALTSDGPASACNTAGTTTYELGKSLGTVTPTSVTLSADQGSANSIILELNAADTSTLGKVTGDAIDKNLAIILDGRVLSAPLVKTPITSSPLTLAFGTASEAKQTAAKLRSPAPH